MSAFFRFHLGVPLFVLAGMFSFVFAADPDVTVRQVVIRAPESRVVTALMVNPSDDALAKILWSWVDDGTAKIVSQVSDLYGKNETVTVRSGKQSKRVSEVDQDFDKGTLIPMRWEEVFVGTSLEAKMLGRRSYKNSPTVEAEWKAFFSPRDEENVRWPTWWPAIPKPMVNRFDMQDFYVEKVETTARFVSQGDVILGVMRQADQIEPDPKRVKTLDIVVAQMNTFEKPAPSVTIADADQASARSRLTVLEFGVKDHEALDLLSRVDLDHDKNLLDELLKRVTAGKGILRTCSALSQLSGQRARLESSREYSFPTEMPTIPSAWEMRPVGTILETDYISPRSMNLTFEHHPALPRHAEWRCALDSPALIMWQPQFIVQKIQTTLDFSNDGVALLGAIRTPDCLQGVNGVVPGETLLFFAKLDEMTPKDPVASNLEPGSFDLSPPRIELEAVVFEVSASEASAWSLDSARFDDGDRFTKLMAHTKENTAKIAAHVAVSTKSGQRANVSIIEEVITVTEVDPPQDEWPGRYRPTAMETIPCGTIWEADPVIEPSKDPFDHGAPEVHLTHHILQHHVSSPQEPGYQEMIEITRKTIGRTVPKATIFEETWEGEVTLKPGVIRFIGLKHPPGDAFKDKLHLAFVRARVAK